MLSMYVCNCMYVYVLYVIVCMYVYVCMYVCVYVCVYVHALLWLALAALISAMSENVYVNKRRMHVYLNTD